LGCSRSYLNVVGPNRAASALESLTGKRLAVLISLDDLKGMLAFINLPKTEIGIRLTL
jgi:hypothetical protein